MGREGLLTIFFFAGIILFVGMTTFVLSSQSIRLDESQSIWMAVKPLPTLVKLLAQDVHVPLYFFLLHFWMQLFGNSIVSTRILSFIFYLLTIPVLYQLVKEIGTKTLAYVTVVFFILSPFVIWYSLETRMYTLFTFITSVNHIFFLRFIRSFGKSSKVGYLISTIIGLYTHYFFGFVVVSQLIYAGIKAYKHISLPPFERKFSFMPINIKRFIFLFLVIPIVGFVTFLPWLFYVFKMGLAANTQPLIPAPTSFNIFQIFVFFFFGFQNNVSQGVLVALWPLFTVMLLLLFSVKRRLVIANTNYFFLISFVPIILTFALSFVIKPIFLARYLIFTIPSLCLLLSYTLLNLNFSKRMSLVLINTLFFLMLSFSYYQSVSASVPVKEDYKGVTMYINENVQSSDVVTVSAPFTIYPIDYYYTGKAKITTIPRWDRFSQGEVPPFSIQSLDKQMDQYKKQYTRMFLVLSYDQGYEEKIRNYLDHKYHVETHRKFSPGLELRVYKLRYDVKVVI